jgi:drug/metabolite transporter (DMT)-like permease
MRSKPLAIAEATIAVVVWGASFIATKIALQDVSPVTVVWLRFSIGLLIIAVGMFAMHQAALPQRKDLLYFALLGFLGISFHQWLQSNGLVTSQASTTAWIVTTTPIFIAILAWLFLKEHLGWLRVLGITLAFLGVLLVVTQGNLALLRQGQFGRPGDILILISAVNWAVFSVLSRRGLQSQPATRMLFYVMGFGWLFTSIQFFTTSGFQEIALLRWQGWLAIGFLGIFCSGLAYIFWYDALQALTATETGVFLYIEPLVAVVVAAILLQEQLVLASLIGGGIILIGVWLVNRQSR